MSSEIGNFIKLTLFGESHGTAVGAVLDSPPAGYEIDLNAVKSLLRRRAPGTSTLVSARTETDEPEFISGLLNGITTGTPLTVIIRNSDQNRVDYDQIKNTPRPSHADYAAYVRFGGYCDMSGGGHFSGRLTAPLTAMGAVAECILDRLNITVGGHISNIGGICDEALPSVNPCTSLLNELKENTFPVISESAGKKIRDLISDVARKGDSVGGEVEIAVTGLPAGIGSLMSRGLESIISSAVFCVPAVKGIEFGAGFSFASMNGSKANDWMYYDGETVKCRTNNCGGITGGISNGMPLIIRAAIKPTPSVSCIQETVDLASFENTTVSIKGRHDPCIVPRALPAIEAAVAVALLDALCEVKKL